MQCRQNTDLYVDQILFAVQLTGTPGEVRSRYPPGRYRVSRQTVNEYVSSFSLAFFSNNAVDNLCLKLSHDKLKTLVSTLEAQTQTRWEAPTPQPPRRYDDIDDSSERRSQHIQSYFEQFHMIYLFLDQDSFE